MDTLQALTKQGTAPTAAKQHAPWLFRPFPATKPLGMQTSIIRCLSQARINFDHFHWLHEQSSPVDSTSNMGIPFSVYIVIIALKCTVLSKGYGTDREIIILTKSTNHNRKWKMIHVQHSQQATKAGLEQSDYIHSYLTAVCWHQFWNQKNWQQPWLNIQL